MNKKKSVGACTNAKLKGQSSPVQSPDCPVSEYIWRYVLTEFEC